LANPLKIENASDLVFWTYYMIDWGRVEQGRSDKPCTQCGRLMNTVERVSDKKGQAYDGLVCHHCRTLLWLKSD